MGEVAISIRRKLEISITIVIFLIFVIKAFYDVFFPEKADSVSLAFSVVIGFYIFAYFVYLLINKRISDKNILHIWADKLLTLNFLIMALLIFFIPNTERINQLSPWLITVLSHSFFVLLWISIIVPFVAILLMVSSNPFKKIKKLT